MLINTSFSIVYIATSVAIAMGGGITEPDEKDEEAICGRTT